MLKAEAYSMGKAILLRVRQTKAMGRRGGETHDFGVAGGNRKALGSYRMNRIRKARRHLRSAQAATELIALGLAVLFLRMQSGQRKSDRLTSAS